MPIPIVHGITFHGTHVGEREHFCGRCMRETSQALYALQERSHVYFVTYGPSADAGGIAICRECHVQMPIFDREAESEAEAMVDAFLDVHYAPLENATRSVKIFLAGGAIACVVFLLSATAAFVLPGAWPCGAVLLLGALGLYAWIRLRFRMANDIFGRVAAPRVAELRRLTGWTHEQILDRADARGYLRLRDYLVATWPDAE